MARQEPSRVLKQSYPLYNTTFTLYRLSPLYHGHAGALSLLDNTILQRHARHFQDIIKGEVLRGVHVGLAPGNSEGLGKAGSLLRCSWQTLRTQVHWTDSQEPEEKEKEREKDLEPEPTHGIQIELQYEKSTYTALILQDPQSSMTNSVNCGFTYLPLLLIRMPGPLRETLLEYLASSFDTRPSAIKLSSGFLATSLERFLSDITAPIPEDFDDISDLLRSVVKDIQITISFRAPAAPQLKNIDIIISKEDIWPLLCRGRTRPKPEFPNIWIHQHETESREIERSTPGPFMIALSQYLTSHMALPLFQSDVILSKIACGAFVLGSEGKVKIFPPSDKALAHGNESFPGHLATQAFIKYLLKRADGTFSLSYKFLDAQM
ncbi:MAG: hypothetical protein M1829_005484 [Trizodia sp. TS-e1964]|nr:MAG: hypothetical protein M1829_005484 [Trizodia sp. TS-e1964]